MCDSIHLDATLNNFSHVWCCVAMSPTLKRPRHTKLWIRAHLVGIRDVTKWKSGLLVPPNEDFFRRVPPKTQIYLWEHTHPLKYRVQSIMRLRARFHCTLTWSRPCSCMCRTRSHHKFSGHLISEPSGTWCLLPWLHSHILVLWTVDMHAMCWFQGCIV